MGCAMRGKMVVLVAHVEMDGKWVFETRWSSDLMLRRDGVVAPLPVGGLCVVLIRIDGNEGRGDMMTGKTMVKMKMVQRMIGLLVWRFDSGPGGEELLLVGFVSLGRTQMRQSSDYWTVSCVLCPAWWFYLTRWFWIVLLLNMDNDGLFYDYYCYLV